MEEEDYSNSEKSFQNEFMAWQILYTHTYMHTYKLIQFIHPQTTSGSLNLEDSISLIIQWKEKINFILDEYMYFQAVYWVHNSGPFSVYFITTVPNRER